MNENNHNSYDYQNSEPDYYAEYKTAEEKKARRTFSRIGFAITSYLVVSFLAALIAEIVLIAVFGFEGYDRLLTNAPYIGWILNFAPMYLVAFPVFYLVIRKMRMPNTKKTKLTAFEFFSMFLICQVVMYIGNLIGTTINSFFSVIKGGAVVDHTGELISSMPIWLICAIVVVVGPIIEELMFRKLLMDRLFIYGNKIAIIVSAIAFGLFHGNLYQFFYAAFVGIVFGFVYAKTKDVRYTIALHILINFMGSAVPMLLMDHITRLEEFIESIMMGYEVSVAEFFKSMMIVGSYSAVQYAMIISGAVMLYKFIKKKRFNIPDRWEYKLPREKASAIVTVNAGAIIFIVISLLLFAYSVII